MKTSAWLVFLYVIGAIVVILLTLYQFLSGSITRENAALWMVLPFAWVFGYWGVVGPALMARKTYAIMSTLDTLQKTVPKGTTVEQALTPEQLADLREHLIDMAAAENGLPKFLVRRIVNGYIKRLGKNPAGNRQELTS